MPRASGSTARASERPHTDAEGWDGGLGRRVAAVHGEARLDGVGKMGGSRPGRIPRDCAEGDVRGWSDSAAAHGRAEAPGGKRMFPVGPLPVKNSHGRVDTRQAAVAPHPSTRPASPLRTSKNGMDPAYPWASPRGGVCQYECWLVTPRPPP
eukprot:scaffold12496_cov108-Isochrysis_galbana.AAC.1